MNASEMPMDRRFDVEWESRWAHATLTVDQTELSGAEWVIALRAMNDDDRDRTYLSMVKQMRAGDETPLRIILKAMMPRIVSLSRLQRCSGGYSGADRMAHLMTAAWVAIRETSVTRTAKFQAGFAMDIYNQALKFETSEWTIDPHEIEIEIPFQETSDDPMQALTRVLSWALQEGVLDRESVMVIAKDLLGEHTRSEIAEEMEISVSALSRRIERATASLILSVQQKYRYVGLWSSNAWYTALVPSTQKQN